MSARRAHRVRRARGLCPRAMVSAICRRAACPSRAPARNSPPAWRSIFGGIGGSFGSTTASIRTGPGEASACLQRLRAGFRIVDAKGRQRRSPARRSRSRSAASSQTYSGLPRKTICSHLIWPSALFLMTMIFTSRLYLTQRRDLAHQHGEPAVADEATTCRSG